MPVLLLEAEGRGAARAKSAATIVALGADEIVTGVCSEIGPIDAQIPLVVGGVPHLVSAQSFIDARDELEARFSQASKNQEDPRAILQQLASLDPAFIAHCSRLTEFGRDIARTSLQEHMFASLEPEARDARIEALLKELSFTQLFKVHGRMIDGNAAKTRLGLNVRLLAKDDAVWDAVWGYYLRAQGILSGRFGEPVSKVVETRNSFLVQRVRIPGGSL